MRRKLVALALLLPVVTILVAIVRAELRRARAEDWTFLARGYDPRDLLRGHYVRFRIDFAEKQSAYTCSNDDPDCCLCLSKAPGSDVAKARRMTCHQAEDQCDGMLQTRFIRRLNRYYVPENRAREFDIRVRGAGLHGRVRVVLSIDPAGRAEIRGLLVDGQRLE